MHNQEHGLKNLVEILRYRKQNQPDQVILHFLSQGKEEARASYSELDRRAQTAAAHFTEHYHPGDRVLLCLVEGVLFLEAFFGCLYAGLVPIPLPPPGASAYKRYQWLARETRATLAVTTHAGLAKLEQYELGVPILSIDGLPLTKSDAVEPREINEDSVAYIQSTAGTTGPAKTVMITHRNLMQNLKYIASEISHEPGDMILNAGSLHQDLALVYGMLMPIYCGITAVQMSSDEITNRPLAVFKAMSDYKVTHLCGPNFGYETYFSQIQAQACEGIDLSSVRSALVTGEFQIAGRINLVADAFGYLGLRQGISRAAWGLTEACLLLSITRAGELPQQLSVDAHSMSCGQVKVVPLAGPFPTILESSGSLNPALHGIVVDPETLEENQPDRIGEIWVSNNAVGNSYLNRQQQTERTFMAYTRDGQGPFLRTGDLGFFYDCQVYIISKLIDQVVIHGAHYSPYLIEKTIYSSHPHLRQEGCAVFSVDNERLIALQEITAIEPDHFRPEEIYEHVIRAVAERHYLELDMVVLLRTGHLAKGLGGKIQRRVNRVLFMEEAMEMLSMWERPMVETRQTILMSEPIRSVLSSREPSVGSGSNLSNSVKVRKFHNSIETRLIGILAPTLGLNLADFDTHLPFSHYGMGSASALTLVNHLKDCFELDLPQTLLFDFTTVATLTRYLAQLLSPENSEQAKSLTVPVQTSRNMSSSSTLKRIGNKLMETIARELKLEPPSFGLHQPFTTLALDATALTSLAQALTQALNTEITEELLAGYPTIFSLSRYLAIHLPPQTSQRHDTLAEPKPAAPPVVEHLSKETIAIVGIGCRYPGACDPQAFWELLSTGMDAISDHPPIRKQGAEQYFIGGFLEDIDLFDPEFFGMASQEIKRMDPQQRFLLEMTYQALGYAGIAPDRLEGSATGVYIGAGSHDYERLQIEEQAGWDVFSSTGNALSITANRISYQLDLRGPSLAIDTACSSSLVAVHLAGRDLQTKEIDLALVGGVNLLLDPQRTAGFVEAGVMPTDGRCKTWDADADGYVRSEGCGMVVLKRLHEAKRDNNPIVALLQGSAINQNGRSNGLKAPNGQAQEACLSAALKDAGVMPNQISFLEAHGTGTELSDSIEFSAATAVYGQDRNDGQTIAMGSVKTNLGHTEFAAGLASFIKAALSLYHGYIPANLHFRQLSPQLKLRPGFYIPVELTPWPRTEKIRLAGVSSFGFGGVNAHAILREAPASSLVQAKSEKSHALYVLPLSAQSGTALGHLVQEYRDYLRQQPDTALGDICYTASVGRSHYGHRLSLSGKTSEKIATRLNAFLNGHKSTTLYISSRPGNRRPKVAFMFTGQGAQYPGMGRVLYQFHLGFQETVNRCDALFALHLGESILPILFADEQDKTIHQTLYTQVTLFTLEYALAELLISLGVTPDALIGHSIGELVAACVAGVMTLEDAVHLVSARATLMQSLPEGGRMLAVFESEQRTRAFMDGDEVVVAVENSPHKVVVSGPTEAVDAIEKRLKQVGIRVHPVAVPHPYHSAWMDPILDEFEDAADEVSYEEPVIPLYSNLTGEMMKEAPDGAYWRGQVRETIRFASGIENLIKDGHELLIEIGPRQVLSGLAAECCSVPCLAMMKPGRNDWSTITNTMARLYSAGLDINWELYYRHFNNRILPDQPKYSYDLRRHWFAKPTDVVETHVLKTKNLNQHVQSKRIVDKAMADYGISANSISQLTGKPFMFIKPYLGAFCYFNCYNRTLMALDYTGPEQVFVPFIKELAQYAQAQELELNLLEPLPNRLNLLTDLDYTSTLIGVWQNLPDPEHFTLKGSKMRHLRYSVNKYTSMGVCTIQEYEFGTDPEIDHEVTCMIEDWCHEKPISVALTTFIKEALLQQARQQYRYRMFRVCRDQALHAIIVITPSPAHKGWLMDMEFYRKGMPLGCIEFGILGVWKKLRKETAPNLSLGMTPGVYCMPPHANEDPKLAQLLKQLHDRNELNDDGNLQFKNKFRPLTSGSYLCRARHLGDRNFRDVQHLLAKPCWPSKADLSWGRQQAKAIPLNTPQPPRHPLLHHQLQLAIQPTLYETYLDLNHLPYLNDHQIGDHILLPATAYVEMLREAVAGSSMASNIIEKVTILRPMTLTSETPQHLQLVLRTSAEQQQAEILSQTEEGSWQLHVQAVYSQQQSTGDLASLDREQVLARCPKSWTAGAFFAHLQKSGYRYAGPFQRLKQIWIGKDEALGQVLGETGSPYHFSPDVLDSCVQVCLATIPAMTEQVLGIYLPVLMQCLTFSSTPGSKLWAYAKLIEQTRPDTLPVRLTIFNEVGAPLACIEQIHYKRFILDHDIVSPTSFGQ